ncbi:ketosteroid isomerase-like protein [Sphaerotilus hippei]|uniref:Ketosteroid isomerase-like protein n=1 Tax=Sphaerotilus hippei TaxID=744406 RepID=A0A318H0X6_9BURK|nr:ketosteroid isomerase-like protein [Sphaerotilus hippei]
MRFYEALQPADLDRLAQLYSEQAWFKDPFNEVSGLAAIRRIFAHMFEVLHGPRFVVHDIVAEGDQCFLTWTFSFALSPRAVPLQVRGTSQLRFAPDGRVAWHRDYWDAAEELYAQLPVLGVLMRWLQRRLRSR